jgi:hypothetical protein
MLFFPARQKQSDKLGSLFSRFAMARPDPFLPIEIFLDNSEWKEYSYGVSEERA